VILSKKNIENARTICNYIIAEQTEINIKDSTKEGKIKILIWLSNHFQDQKSFKDMTKYDILDFLNTRRKSILEDPYQKWTTFFLKIGINKMLMPLPLYKK
jgi:hypothetical protein